MCLDKVDKKRRCKVSGYGYKVFNIYYDYRYEIKYLRFKYKSYKECVGVPCNKWIKTDQPYEKDFGYSPNFHVYKYKEEAESNCKVGEVVIRVKYRKATCTGTQIWKKVIVAKEIYVLWSAKKQIL